MDENNGEAGENPASGQGEPDFDFANFDLAASAERGATLDLRNPRTGMPTGVKLELHGADARSYRVALRRIRDTVAANPEREPTDEDDSLILDRARQAAAAVHGWFGVKVEGSPIDYSQDNVVELFVRYPWAADQVLSYINNRGNF